MSRGTYAFVHYEGPISPRKATRVMRQWNQKRAIVYDEGGIRLVKRGLFLTRQEPHDSFESILDNYDSSSGLVLCLHNGVEVSSLRVALEKRGFTEYSPGMSYLANQPNKGLNSLNRIIRDSSVSRARYYNFWRFGGFV